MMFLLAALLCNYGRDKCLIDVDTKGQSTALGRRDYAILLLAARYGLRPCDIRQLTLDDIDWRTGRIDLRQLKTGRPLALPLLPDVAQPLSAYIRDGHPASSDRTVFLRHCAPFEPFAPENNLTANVRGALQRAGFAGRSGRRGLYLFRHTLATQLLASGRPLRTIADVLGHASTEPHTATERLAHKTAEDLRQTDFLRVAAERWAFRE